MENLACNLLQHLQRREDLDVTSLINRRGKKSLPIFLPSAVVQGANTARRHKIEAIHLADALLAPVGVALKRLTGLPVTASVCGLDVTYPNRFYQAAIPRALKELALVMPISRATEEQLRARAGFGVPSVVVPLGINPLPVSNQEAAHDFRASIGVAAEKPIVLTVGRLIARKGVAWFVGEVLPRLGSDVVYVIVGDGPERDRIAGAAAAQNVSDRVRQMGRVDDATLASAYAAADVFVMPNVPVPGDIEGFGLVALEAAAAGVPVIAADLEGIRQAVRHGHNGLLASAKDAQAWAEAISSLLALPPVEREALGARFSAAAMADYSWDKTAARYAALITDLVRGERAVAAAA
ncbi:MAG: glycosyltransferase family 4 protein [Chloroflexi bacterium]|nr:glycosyltransferase family 4 protein [Chloroflexota bacterium]